MLLEDDGVHLSSAQTSTRSDHGRLTWVDDIDKATPTEYWTVGRDASTDDAFRIENHQLGTTPVRLDPDDTLVVPDLRVTGAVTDSLHMAGTHTRVSGFDASSEHWLHAGAGKTTDQILAYKQHSVGDYSVLVREGDQTNAVLTEGDLGTVDAGTLDGIDSTGFVQTDGTQPLTAPWGVGDRLDNVAAVRYADSAADGVEWRTTEDAVSGDYRLTAYDTASATAANRFRVTTGGDVHADSGTIYQQGNAVLTTATNIGVDAENTNGTPLVAGADAIYAGTDLSFSDDGDETVTLSFTGTVDPSSAAVGDTATASGDGTTTTFTLSHSLGAVPDAVSVDPASPAASTSYRISNVTSTAVDITYETAPPTGTSNLSWHITTTASGLTPVTVSDDGTTVLPSPDDINFGTGVTVADDADGTVTVRTDSSVGLLGSAETVTAAWDFDAGLTAAPDQDIGWTNSLDTVQFAFAYDSVADQHVWADRANALTLAEADRTGTVNFPNNLQVGGTDVATTGDDLANNGSGTAPAEAVPEADGAGNIQWNRRTDGASHTASGDGTTTTFAIPHNFGKAPGSATVTPTTKAAMSDFYVSNKTTTDVVVTYATAPPSGTSNLGWDVTVHD